MTEWLEQETAQESHTQEILAERLSRHLGRTVSQSTVSLIARGKQQPRADLVAAFRVELGIDVEAWLPDAGPLPLSADTDDDAA